MAKIKIMVIFVQTEITIIEHDYSSILGTVWFLNFKKEAFLCNPEFS